MPLVRLFAHKALTKAIPLPKLQARLCEIWGVKPQTTKLLLTRVDDWTSDQFDEDVYVSVRAKATPERTRDVVLGPIRRRANLPSLLFAVPRVETRHLTAIVQEHEVSTEGMARFR